MLMAIELDRLSQAAGSLKLEHKDETIFINMSLRFVYIQSK